MEHHSGQCGDDQRDIALTPAQKEWIRCRPMIEAALIRGRGFEDIEDVESRIEDGQYQFWPMANSAVITEIQNFPARRILMVRHAGGDMQELMSNEPRFCEFARAMNCDAIAGEGRDGWRRVAQKHGYRFGSVMMMKDLYT